MNRTWHQRHPMPPRATFEERCLWHEKHAKACACRPVPRSLEPFVGEAVRRLADLHGVGEAFLRDFDLLRIRTVEELASADPQELYDRLCRKTRERQDPCVLDVFCCAVAQARDPRLPTEQRRWCWWSRKRKRQAVNR
jgi:hypothetical protein